MHFSSFFQKSIGYECGHSLKKEYNKDSSRNEEVNEDVLKYNVTLRQFVIVKHRSSSAGVYFAYL